MSPPRFHQVDAARLLFLAVPGELDSLAAVTTSGDDGEVTTMRGVIPLGPGGSPAEVRDIPWTQATAPPVMAAASGRWMVVLSQPEAMGPRSKLWLWREGGSMQLLAEGDQLAAADASCSGSSCAILTTRPTAVASPGAWVWVGGLDEPVSSWRRHEIAEELRGARPLTISGYDAAESKVTVAVDTGATIAFFQVLPDVVRDAGSVPRGGSLLDTTVLGAGPAAFMATGSVTDEGCAPEGAKLQVVQPGRAPAQVALPEMPESGYARSLGQGAFVSWIARVNCKDPRRKVVKAMLVSALGSPGAVMTVGDADGYAVSTSGSEVVLWLRGPKGITEVRAGCTAGE